MIIKFYYILNLEDVVIGPLFLLVSTYMFLSVVNLIAYSDIDKMMDINNEKC